MKNNLTKNLLIVFTALLLVGVLTFCAACDPYAGNYVEVSQENRQEFVATASEKLNKIIQEGLDNVKLTYIVSSTFEVNGETSTTKKERTVTVDGKKTLVELKYDFEGENTLDLNAKIWFDKENEEVYYQVTHDEKTEEGKYSREYVSDEVNMAFSHAQECLELTVWFVEAIEEFLNNADVKIYADGNNFKLIKEADDDYVIEYYFIFKNNGAFMCKANQLFTHENSNGSERTQESAEMTTTNSKVTLPNFD